MSKLVVVKGIKRTGKTSLMKTALNVTGLPYIYLDTRFSENPHYLDFINVLRTGIKDFLKRHQSAREKAKRVFSTIRWVRVTLSPISVEIRWKSNQNTKSEQRFSLPSLLSSVNSLAEDMGMDIVVAIDEVQELRKIK